MDGSKPISPPSHLRLYRQLARVLARHGGNALVKNTPLAQWAGEDSAEHQGNKLAADLERLGPTFVKLGQLLSTRSDLLPASYLESLERLQDDVEPLPYSVIRQVIIEELGTPPEELFFSFDTAPLAAASLGQVHRAQLRSGEDVILKVQRPDVRDRVTVELKVLREVSTVLERHTELGRDYDLNRVVEELSTSLSRELDYLAEAANLERMRKQLRPFESLIVPRPFRSHTTHRVLTMEYVEGIKLPEDTAVSLGITRERREELADLLMQAYLRQVLLDGVYHADPHPGNVLLTPDGKVCLLDLGMIGRMPKSLQFTLARLLVAIGEEDGEEAARLALDASDRREDFDERRFRRRLVELVGRHHEKPLEELQAGRIILDICQTAAANGIVVPYELTMLAKTLMNLDEIGRRLAPQFDPTEALRRHAQDILLERATMDLTPTAFLHQLLDLRELVQQAPRRLSSLLQDLESGRFRVRVDAVDEREFLVSFQKIANRITSGLVIAALILGASLMLSVDTPGLRILGYPAFAILCFVAAASGGVWLVWSIFRQDRASRKEHERARRRRMEARIETPD